MTAISPINENLFPLDSLETLVLDMGLNDLVVAARHWASAASIDATATNWELVSMSAHIYYFRPQGARERYRVRMGKGKGKLILTREGFGIADTLMALQQMSRQKNADRDYGYFLDDLAKAIQPLLKTEDRAALRLLFCQPAFPVKAYCKLIQFFSSLLH